MISNEEALAAFKNLSKEERELAVKILNQYSTDGKSDILEDLKYSDFEEIPVDIDTFLDDEEYLGRGIWITDEFTGERKCTLFPYWRDTLHKLFPDNLTSAYNTLILTGAIGLGKAQPLDALVLTDNGYKQMGTLTLKDKVYGVDGKLHNILGIFPQGKKKVCKVTFTDGTSTECCDEHLWTVYNIKSKHWSTVETKELLAADRNLNHSKGHRYKIPMVNPVEFKHKDILIPAYTLGALLGDGSLTTQTTFASNDIEIVDNIKQELLPEYCLHKISDKYSYSICQIHKKHDNKGYLTPNIYSNYFKANKLNVTSQYKYIPKEYLYNDISTRIALLQGLMDTDGYISKDGSLIEFTTISEQLKNDFIFLVQSLGGTCHIRLKHSFYRNKQTGEKIYGQPSFNIGIKLPSSICPFKLTRKKERLNKKALEPFRYIKSIEYIKDAECQCIYVDAKEHLYLTNDFIVTHNTLVGVLAMLYLLYRMLCLKDPYTYYGMMPSDKITFSMLNITLDAAQGVGWDKMQQLLQGSEWFMEHGTMNASRTNPQWQPPKGIEVVFGSNNRHVVGRALFCLDGDTIIKTSLGDKSLKDLVNKPIQAVSIDSEGNEILSDLCTVKPTIQTTEEIQIELEDDSVIKCTPNHRLMLKNGTYKEAQYLTEDDELAEQQSKQSTQTYFEFIDSIIAERGQWNETIKKEGCERHHILPKCLGGEPQQLNWEHHPNIIWLTPAEHFTAHKLLALANPQNHKLMCAYKRMCYSKTASLENVTAEDYQNIKMLWGKAHSKALKGKPLKPEVIQKRIDTYSEERKQKLSKQFSGKNNNMYKKGYKIAGTKNGCYGHPVEPERLAKIKKSRTKFIYTYNSKDFYGWYDLQSYLKANGYPKISQAGIEACVQGKDSIKKLYPNLVSKITKRPKEEC